MLTDVFIDHETFTCCSREYKIHAHSQEDLNDLNDDVRDVRVEVRDESAEAAEDARSCRSVREKAKERPRSFRCT